MRCPECKKGRLWKKKCPYCGHKVLPVATNKVQTRKVDEKRRPIRPQPRPPKGG